MNILLLMIPITFILISCFVVAFIWSMQSGQYDDTTTPAYRILFDDEQGEKKP